MTAEPFSNEFDRRPVCVLCEMNFRCERNGVIVRMYASQVADADLYTCPSCGVQILVGFGKPVDEGEPTYEESATTLGAHRIVGRNGQVYA